MFNTKTHLTTNLTLSLGQPHPEVLCLNDKQGILKYMYKVWASCVG